MGPPEMPGRCQPGTFRKKIQFYGRANDRSAVKEVHTIQLDNAQDLYTVPGYDMYYFEKSVTLRTPA